jgi:hypothetical protein
MPVLSKRSESKGSTVQISRDLSSVAQAKSEALAGPPSGTSLRYAINSSGESMPGNTVAVVL